MSQDTYTDTAARRKAQPSLRTQQGPQEQSRLSREIDNDFAKMKRDMGRATLGALAFLVVMFFVFAALPLHKGSASFNARHGYSDTTGGN
jgi:hypothetical protein